jgi:hypothetical protein
MQMCVFPDLSSIDDWGLTYHSNGIIRGRDLTDLFRFDLDEIFNAHMNAERFCAQRYSPLKDRTSLSLRIFERLIEGRAAPLG